MKIFYQKKNIFFFCLVVFYKIHLKKYFQCLVLHVKHFLENCQKPYLNTSKSQPKKKINCNKEQIIVTTSTKSCKQNKNTLYEPYKIPDLEGKETSWVLRGKNGGKKSEWLRKKERQIEKEIERSVMGGSI